MPISLKPGPGIASVTPKRPPRDPYGAAPSLILSRGASGIGEVATGGFAPGTPRGGLSFDQAMHLNDLRSVSAYDIASHPLTIPASVIAFPGSSGSLRTGSFDLDLLDLHATLQQATGSGIGQERPLMGMAGQTDLLTSALDIFGQYGTAPAKIMDYGVAAPLTWARALLGANAEATNGPRTADGRSFQPFQEDPLYWSVLSQSNDAQLLEMATKAAEASVGQAMVPAVRDQLLATFRADQLSLSGLSSGNERADYLAKKALERAIDIGRAGRSWEDYAKAAAKGEGGNVSFNPFDGAFLPSVGGLFGSVGQTVMSFIPIIGTPLASSFEPVKVDTERQWQMLTSEERRSLLGITSFQMAGTDLATSLPLFSGLGQVIGLARSGAAGAEFVSVAGDSGSNALLNMARQAAYNLGRPALRLPAALTEGGVLGAKFGGRFAMGTEGALHITNVYDGVLQVGKIMLAEGVASWGANWALKSFVPGYAAELGTQIDNSHWVSESSAAAFVDQIGLFTGGSLGAGTLLRMTKGLAGGLGREAGLAGSPFRAPYAIHFGEAETSLAGKAFGLGESYLQQPASNYMLSLVQRWNQNGLIELAGKMMAAGDHEGASRLMADGVTTPAEMATRLATVIKAADEPRYGFETEAWVQRHGAVQKTARMLLDDMARIAESENGVSHWSALLARMMDEAGQPLTYSVEGLQSFTKILAKSAGLDPAAVDAIAGSLRRSGKLGARGALDSWRRVANGLYHYAFDHHNGVLKGVIDSGSSREASDLFVMRQGHLEQGMAALFRQLLAEHEAGVTDHSAKLADLFERIKATPEIRQWWSGLRGGADTGARSVDDLSMRQVDNFLAQIEEHLPAYRVAPGPNAEPGALNDLHRNMLDQGIWDLAFKPSEPTAIGTIQTQMQQAAKALADYELKVATASKEMDRTYNALADYRRELDIKLADKYTEPLNIKYQGKPATPESNAAFAKAYASRDRAMARDKQMKALTAANDAAIAAHDAAEGGTLDRPLGARIGPVEPAGYASHPDDVVNSADMTKNNNPHNVAQYRAGLAEIRKYDVMAGEGIWHVTTDWPNVEKQGGLLAQREREVRGLSRKGLGGGNIGIATTVSFKHAQLIEGRLRLATDLVNNRASTEDVITHFKGDPAYRIPAQIADKLDHRARNEFESLRLFDDTPDAWTALLGIVEHYYGPTGPIAAGSMHPSYRLLQSLDSGVTGDFYDAIGRKILMVGDGSELVGLDSANIRTLRLSVRKGTEQFSAGPDPSELQFLAKDVFVNKALPDQPFRDPIEEPLTDWGSLGPMSIPVSYVAVRDPVTGEQGYFKSPFLEYPHNADAINVGNRNLLARKYDDLFRGWRAWRISEYQKGQVTRLFSTKYDVDPAQIDRFWQGALHMAYEKWSPTGGKYLQTPIGGQAAASLRAGDVAELGARIFGSVKDPITGAIDAAPIRNRITGAMEVPDYSAILVEGLRQAWTLNFTSALTSKLYTFGAMGALAQGTASWLVPLIRYVASPVFKASEIVESWGFNKMEGAPVVTDALRGAYAERGMTSQIGQVGQELVGGADPMLAGLLGGLPTAAEAMALHPNGIADLTGPFAVAQELREVAALRTKDSRLPSGIRATWDMIANPTPYKDKMAGDLAIKVVRDSLPGMIQKADPEAYSLFHDTLKVPDSKLADFIAVDRSLFQGWQDGSVTFEQMLDHHYAYNKAPKAAETGEDMKAMYASEAWQATDAMFRLAAKTAQSEAFGVHFFGSYRSTFERSINHPVLGVYPASWAYKAAKQWFKFLFDNRTFGNGELRLGATPAAYIQSLVHAQSVAWAQNNSEDLHTWMRDGPLGNAFFIFNLLMPGDWSDLPFPASRSIRAALRGNLNPVDHLEQNFFGPQGRGGIGAIRDFNAARLGIVDLYEQFATHKNDSDWDKIINHLAADGRPPPPPGFDEITKYPVTTLTPQGFGP